MRMIRKCNRRWKNRFFLRFSDKLGKPNIKTHPKGFEPKSSAARRLEPSSARLSHLALAVVLQAHFVDQIHLGFQKVDVLFGVVPNALQQVA